MGRKKASAPTTYESLPVTKTKNGYLYKQIKRTDKVAIYEQSVENENNGDVGRVVAYEVFLIVIAKAYSLVQKHGQKQGQIYNYPASEKFPGNEDFGKWAWTFHTKDAAMEKFNALK